GDPPVGVKVTLTWPFAWPKRRRIALVDLVGRSLTVTFPAAATFKVTGLTNRPFAAALAPLALAAATVRIPGFGAAIVSRTVPPFPGFGLFGFGKMAVGVTSALNRSSPTSLKAGVTGDPPAGSGWKISTAPLFPPALPKLLPPAWSSSNAIRSPFEIGSEVVKVETEVPSGTVSAALEALRV